MFCLKFSSLKSRTKFMTIQTFIKDKNFGVRLFKNNCNFGYAYITPCANENRPIEFVNDPSIIYRQIYLKILNFLES